MKALFVAFCRRLLAAALFGCACLAAQAAPQRLDQAQARHLLLRSGFAPTQAEVDRLVGQGAVQAVDGIIAAARTAASRNPPPAFVDAPPPSPPRLLDTREQRQAWRQQQLREGQDLKAWWMSEMVASPTPLAERMTLFWHGHFATSQQKVVRSQAMWRQHQLLRAQALGNFAGLLHAVARDPAMLAYLDGASSRKEAPNENFAREVMELFALGEASQGGGYSEQDVREAARAFTGWSVERDDFAFRLRPAFHDGGTKTVFGRSGAFDGDAVIDLMLQQPAAARFITAKLWKEFVSPAPQGPEFEAIADRFRASGYDISTVLHDLLLSDAFWATENRGALIKSPVELVVGAVRQFGLQPPDPLPLVRKSAQLGQNLLLPPNVKGWPGYTDWIDATRLLERKHFAEQLFRAAGAMQDPPPWAERFLAGYGGHADREPDAALQVRLAAAMLPLAPTQPVPAGTVGVAWLRALMLDPAYQLK
ncbi:DUF1800 family protein [Caenimonas terrae]|uniref:DUF1800 family protein n=1 Tax=Caenimonas terrae TaxID=696074 RepID=A0ABW0NAH3_9BURK